jgi:hypothetical protein
MFNIFFPAKPTDRLSKNKNRRVQQGKKLLLLAYHFTFLP